MVKKKRQRLMTDVYPEGNFFEEGGPMMGMEYYDDGSGLVRTRLAQPTMNYDISDSPLRSRQFDGSLRMDKLSRGDAASTMGVSRFRNLDDTAKAQFRDYNSQVRDNNKQYNQDVKAAAKAADTTQGGGNVNVGGIIGAAANNTITALTDPNMRTSERVATALGAPALAKIWSPNMEAANNALNDAQSRINNVTNRYITDSNDTQGAFSAIKENNQFNRIDLSGIKQPTLKDFIGKRFKNGLTATLQGAASGSVGGPWGALGGAVTGMLGSLFGGIGQKKRARRAMAEYQDKMNYMQRFASNFNSFQKLNQQQSNENLLSNGLRQQRVQDLANIRAYGGNLFDNGGEFPPPYYPESQDPTAVQWLSDWYRQRPEQLKNTFYGSTYEMPNPNISGEYEDLNEIPQERVLSPTNHMFGDDLYKNLINRAATASTIYRMDMPPNTLGEYSPAGRGILTENGLVDKPNAAHTISFNMRDVPAFANPEEEYYDKETLPLRVHEYNHPITHGFESLADSINSKAKRKDDVKYDKYYDNPYEIHSYMMEFRQRAGLDPTEKVTKDVLDKHRTELKKANLDRFTDDSLIDMLNNVVDNNTNNYNNIAAMGGQFDYNLSPNMIDLQNQSLANQRYKYTNQMQPVGFIDGGAGKIPNPGIPRLACGGRIRRFDFGGSMSGMDLPTGMQYYENGGTHEQNPNGGIQVGVDSQGTPNLTEEGEFRYGDNVFSDRITVDPNLLSEYNVTPATKHQNKKANKGKLSYADMAKKYANKNKELANDPISKDTLDAYMNRLFQAQEAQKARQARENQLADYNSALKTPTQGNPMYGAMKYSGMGNANQGVNEGTDMGMGAMDNSELSNVNRSGNPMMAAYGGRLYADGGTVVTNAGAVMTKQPDGSWVDETGQIKIGPYEMMTALANGTAFEEGTDQYNQIVNPTVVDNNAYLPQSTSVTAVTDNQPMIGANGNPETGVTSNGYSVDPNYIDVNSNSWTNLSTGSTTFTPLVDNNFGRLYTGFGNSQSDLGGGNIYNQQFGLGIRPDYVESKNPNQKVEAVSTYAKNVNGQIQYDPNGKPFMTYPNTFKGLNGKDTYQNSTFGTPMSTNFTLNPINVDNKGFYNFGNTANSAASTTNTNTGTGGSSMSKTKSYTSVSKSAGKVPPEDINNTNSQAAQTPAASTGEGFSTPADTRAVSVDNTLQKQNAGYADYTKPEIPKLSEAGLYSQLGKGLIPNIHNWAGLTNYKFQPNYQPSNRMEALGKTGYVPRTADHSGMYRAADLYDINAANNASQAMNMAMLRNIVNNSNGNRSFVGAQGAALDYNGLMGVGQNYATMFDKNNASRIAAYQDNKQTEQFNVDANNNMYRDNQQAGIQAKNFEYQTLADANRERFQTRTLEDQINRAAAQNKADAMARMFDNQMNYLVDRGRENRIYNMQNQDPTKMYWYDTKNKEWNFKGDSGAYGKLHQAMGSDVKALDSDLLDRWNQHLQERGYANVDDDFISDLVAEQKRRNDNAAQTKAEEKAEKTKQARAKYDYFYNQLDDATRKLLVEGGYNLDRFNIDKDADETTIALATSGLQNAIDDVRKWNRDRIANAQTKAYGGKINTIKNNSYKLHRYTQI